MRILLRMGRGKFCQSEMHEFHDLAVAAGAWGGPLCALSFQLAWAVE